MTGSIVKKGNRWYCIIEMRDPETGERKRKWHSGYRTKKEAEAARTEILSRMQRGVHVEPSKMNLADYLLIEWLPAVSGSLRPSTVRSYESNMRVHVVPHLGTEPLQRVSPSHLNALYVRLLAEGRVDRSGGLSPRTVRYIHTILKKALKDAVKWDLLVRNPADRCDPPASSSNSGRMKTWAAEEVSAFLESVRTDRLFPAWFLAATTGMRRGEILGLRWGDIDLPNSRLSVRQSYGAAGGQASFSAPKSGRARPLSLDEATVRVLKQHRKLQASERLALGTWPEHDLAFTRADGEPIHPDWFSRQFKRQCEAAPVPVIRSHDVRHTWATLALQVGVHPKVVSERLGHSTIAITLDTYSHVTPSIQSEAASLVASLIT